MDLVIQNLDKAYGQDQIIANFSFTMSAGEIVALTGKSGTGKTTFMRLINNLETADRGSVRIGDQYLFEETDQGVAYANKEGQRTYQNRMGMVFQNYALFPNFNVLDNLLEAPLAQKLADKAALERKAMRLLDRMGIADQAQKMPHQLSGGQKQRVAVARALMLEPAFLCLDEPTSALDRDSADAIGRIIQDLAAEGMGVLIVTHDLPFSESYATRTISSSAFLNSGGGDGI